MEKVGGTLFCLYIFYFDSCDTQDLDFQLKQKIIFLFKILSEMQGFKFIYKVVNMQYSCQIPQTSCLGSLKHNIRKYLRLLISSCMVQSYFDNREGSRHKMSTFCDQTVIKYQCVLVPIPRFEEKVWGTDVGRGGGWFTFFSFI